MDNTSSSPQPEITLKEVFEKAIRLETLLSEKTRIDEDTKKTFTRWAIIISVLEILNLWIHSLSIFGHK